MPRVEANKERAVARDLPARSCVRAILHVEPRDTRTVGQDKQLLPVCCTVHQSVHVMNDASHDPASFVSNKSWMYTYYFYSCLAFSAAFLGLTQPSSIGVERMKTGSTVHIASPAKFPPQSALALLYPNRNDPV